MQLNVVVQALHHMEFVLSSLITEFIWIVKANNFFLSDAFIRVVVFIGKYIYTLYTYSYAKRWLICCLMSLLWSTKSQDVV